MKKLLPLLLIAAYCLFSCKNGDIQSFSGSALGTFYTITYVGEEDDRLPNQIDSIFKEINHLYSIFDSTSVVSQINRGDSCNYPPEFIELIAQSLSISEQTGGAFDITVGPLVNLWGFGKDKQSHADSASIDSVRQFVGYEKMSTNENGLVKQDSRIQLNFNAIAKGKAVDEITFFLIKKGYENCVVNVGGEVRNEGRKPNGNLWNVGIQIPTETKDGLIEANYIFNMPGKSVATSGNYRNYKELNGQRYNHIVDPRNGSCKSSNLLSVSVIANDCATADAFATAFMVMGIENSMVFLEKHTELAAHFIYFKDGQYKYAQTANFPKAIAK